MNLAPIVLFVYNRPEVTRKTLVALSKNELAEESDLYIFSDGPKSSATDQQLLRIQQVRKVIREQSWCKNVYISEKETNSGLGSSVISGVTDIINKYGKVIVVEDDLITSPSFLQYMNQSLNYYEKRTSVFSISALSRPCPERFFPEDYQYDVYVSLTHRPWGWGTWKDRWDQVDWGANAYAIVKKDPNIIAAFNRLGADYFDALQFQQENHQNVWSIRFALAHFINHAVSICPIVSYVSNIGWGEDSTNTKGSGDNWNFGGLNTKTDIKFIDILYEDSRIINSWYSFSIAKKRNFLGRLVNRFASKFLNKDEFVLKGKVYE